MKTLVPLVLALFGLCSCKGQPSAPSAPTMSEVQQFWERRIEEESTRRIKPMDFAPEGAISSGENTCIVGYKAEIEFSEQCLWISRSEGGAASFKTVEPGKATPLPGQIFEIPKPSDRFTVKGWMFLRCSGGRWTLSNLTWQQNPMRTSHYLDVQTCMANLKQISIAFRHWASTHNGQFSFNVSTNAGGPAELSLPGADGYEGNGIPHLLVVTNGLFTPRTLVCPADTLKQAASNFQNMRPSNVSYQIRCSTNRADGNPPGVLAHCPIHGHTLCTDGSIRVGNND